MWCVVMIRGLKGTISGAPESGMPELFRNQNKWFLGAQVFF